MEEQKIVIQKEGFFPSDGRWLFYRCWNVTPKRGEIVVIHGAAEHSGRYLKLAKAFADQGYDFHIFDMSGHGRSEGKRGYIYQFEEYLVDIANFYAFLRIHRGMGEPLLLGHSMGGLLATLFTGWGQCPIKALMLSAPLFRLKISISFWQRVALKLLSILYPTFYVENNLSAAQLSHDKTIVKEYVEDHLIQKTVTTRWFSEICKAMKEANYTASHIQIPCFLTHGEKDSITDIEASKVFYEKLASKKKFFCPIPNGYHEVFNEGNTALKKMLQWIQENTLKET